MSGSTVVFILLWILLAFICGWLLDMARQHLDRRNAKRKRDDYRDRYL
jgi:biotin transporter BioY